MMRIRLQAIVGPAQQVRILVRATIVIPSAEQLIVDRDMFPITEHMAHSLP